MSLPNQLRIHSGATIDLGHNMGLKVVAEDLENVAAWELLTKMGCDQGQGYYIGKPMPAEQLAVWLETWTPPQLHADAGPEVRLAG